MGLNLFYLVFICSRLMSPFETRFGELTHAIMSSYQPNSKGLHARRVANPGMSFGTFVALEAGVTNILNKQDKTLIPRSINSIHNTGNNQKADIMGEANKKWFYALFT